MAYREISRLHSRSIRVVWKTMAILKPDKLLPLIGALGLKIHSAAWEKKVKACNPL